MDEGRRDRRLRLGVCGHGWVVEHGYRPALLQSDGPFDVVAIADPAAAARDRALGMWPGAAGFADASTLPAACIDAVLIASPNPHHLAEAAALLRAGLPCLVEKPVLRNRCDLDRLEAAAEGTLLVPALACRRRDDLRCWLAAVEALGPLRALSLTWRRHRGVPSAAWHRRHADGWTGVFADLGAHLVDLLGAALGWRLEGLTLIDLRRRHEAHGGTAGWYGETGTLAVQPETEMVMTVNIGGVACRIDVAWTDDRPGDLVRLDAISPRGRAVLEGLFGFSPERRVPHQRVQRFGSDGRLLGTVDFEPGAAMQRRGFAAVLDAFAADILAERRTDFRPLRFAAAIGSLVETRR